MKMNDEEIEIKLLIDAIRLKTGHDFSRYAKASLFRRIKKVLSETRCKRISEMIPLIIHDGLFLNSFIASLSINVTEMFRDPSFYRVLREKVIPYLKTYPLIKVWSAGASTGEEVYSLAILLREEGIYDKSQMYATDFNDMVLEKAKKGIYPAKNLKKSTLNYQESGGRESFGNYYHAEYESAIFNRSLKENIVFANHNLVTDGSFGEMNLILCRNVLIYFNSDLQNRVLHLFNNSLCVNGFLCLGNKETLNFSDIAESFVSIARNQKIYQKKHGEKWKDGKQSV